MDIETDDEGEAKEKNAREKADAYKKQLQLKLQKLKEGKVLEEDEVEFELTPKVKAELRAREALLK